MKFLSATDSELKILETLWETGKPVGFGELMESVNQRAGTEWKKETLNTFLVRMQRKKLVDTVKSENKRKKYRPCVSRDEYLTEISADFLDRNLGGSFLKMFTALRGGGKLDSEDIQELRQALDNWGEK